MFRRLLISLIAGVVVFLAIFFALPLIASEATVVARVNSLLLDWSNRHFATMPSLLVTYLAHANLTLIAVSAGLLATLAVMLLTIVWSLSGAVFGWLLGLVRRAETETPREELSPIDMQSSFVSKRDGKEVLGRGFDTLERD